MVAKTRVALGLLPKEKKAVREFLARVRAQHGEKIQRAALFGSKTREDWTEDSDVDILLIVENNEREFRRSIIHLAADVELKYDVVLDVRIIPAERWNYYAQIKAGLYLNIRHDAVPVRLPKTRPVTA